MQPFIYHRAASTSDALRTALDSLPKTDAPRQALPPVQAPGQFIAGGTTLLDLMKLDVMRPAVVVDINALPRARAIEVTEQGVRFGALVRMSEAADHPLIRRDYPLLADSLNLAASAQLRNMASLAGNVLQRTRCSYFRDTAWTACNKRTPGSGCAALEGVNRQHAILGVADDCIATYPGDFAQALIALDAVIEVTSVDGVRQIPFAQLHRLPEGSPHIETVLTPGDLISAITVSAGAWTRRSLYLKIRDRESYQFALAAAAVALDMQDGQVNEARIALGGVATVPWRAREAESVLKGRQLDENSATQAAEVAFAGARGFQHNAFKAELGRQTLVRALLQAGQMDIAQA